MMIFLIVLIICALVFSPALYGTFLSFDDPQHVLLNPALYLPLPDALTMIFTQSINKIYLPLTTLSFAIEKHFFGFNPFVFHLNNILLHVAVCLAAFALLQRLGAPYVAAFFATIIFAIHPMKVESIAWITERKDVLYALFYLVSLLAYCAYLQKKSFWLYAVAFLTAALSLLCKPMALSLPLILLLLDWYFRRGFNIFTVVEKIPFFILSISLGWITYAQNMRNPIVDFGSSLLVWMWSCAFYMWKFFFPIHVYAFYKLPEPISLHSWKYALSVLLTILFFISLWVWRYRRTYVFCALFFFLSIFFLLRMDIGVDASVVNDRFMYLPGLGFCWLMGIGLSKLWRTRLGMALIACIIIFLGAKTYQQCLVWQNTLSFYNEVIRTYPDAFSGYNNRAHYYYQAGQMNLALADYNKAIELKPAFAPNYIGRGSTWGMLGQPQKAVDDFTTALSINPSLPEAYYNRSIAKQQLGLFDESLQDAQKAQQLKTLTNKNR